MRLFCTAAALVLVSSVSIAQGPPPEMKKFDALLGNWEGGGVVREKADSPPVKWTSKSTVKKILDGVAVQEDMRMNAGEEVPELVFRTIYAWDAGSSSFVYYSMTNLGYGGCGKVHWADEHTFVVGSVRADAGVLMTDRWLTTVKGDVTKFRLDRAKGSEPFFVHVEGEHKRGGKEISAVGEGVVAIVPAPGEMAKIGRQLGEWEFSCQVTPFPNIPPMKSTGKETVSSILGGHSHMGVIKADPTPGAPKSYQGLVLTSWDMAEKNYAVLSLGNFSAVAFERAKLQGNQMIYTGSGVVYGLVSAHRSVVEWNEKGNRLKIYTDRLAGNHKADKSFSGVFERVKKDR